MGSNPSTSTSTKEIIMTNLQLSKLLSYVLRHKPADIGITLTEDGWTDIADVIAGIERHKGVLIRYNQIIDVVRECDKQRYQVSVDGVRIRAVQGHSIPDIKLEYKPANPPADLWHGTAERFIPSIMNLGLLPQTRNHVHLSDDPDIARIVGSRHGTPQLIVIDVNPMLLDGFEFFQATNGVWLCDHVPAKYLTLK